MKVARLPAASKDAMTYVHPVSVIPPSAPEAAPEPELEPAKTKVNQGKHLGHEHKKDK